jgi:hypothetical protein
MSSAVASFGKGYAIISAVIATITGLLMIGFGIYIYRKPETNPSETTNKKGGIILICLGFLAIIISWLWVLLTQHSTVAADLSAGVGAARLVT